MNSEITQDPCQVGDSCPNVALLLNEPETKYQRLYKNMFDAIIVYDYEKEKILDCNNSALKLLAYNKKELLALNCYDFLLADSKSFPGLNSRKELRMDHGQKVFDGETIYFLSEVLTKNGKKLSTRINVVPLEDQSYQGFVIIQDITNQLEQNKLLQEKEKERNRLYSQQKQLLDAIPAPFLFKDLENNIIACNKAMAKTRGLEDPKDLVGKNLSELITKEEAKRVHNNDLEMVKTGKAIIGKIYSIKDSSGKDIWYRNDKTPYRDADGNITGILSCVVDISELVENNNRLKKYIESNKQLNNFTAIASHDLQAPLRTIHSFTQLLARRVKGKLTEEEKEYMQFILSATSNMSDLIRDLRTYSQVDAGDLNVTRFCLNTLIEEILSELKYTIDLAKAKIHFPDELPYINGDRIKIKQLFQNVIANALKYVNKSVAPEIHLLFEKKADHWYFEIKDNGIGIAEEYQHKIFELFQRLHRNNEEYQGTGIGLSLCKKVVEQHEGTIGVRSVAGEEGSIFYFSISKKVQAVKDLIASMSKA